MTLAAKMAAELEGRAEKTLSLKAAGRIGDGLVGRRETVDRVGEVGEPGDGFHHAAHNRRVRNDRRGDHPGGELLMDLIERRAHRLALKDARGADRLHIRKEDEALAI